MMGLEGGLDSSAMDFPAEWMYRDGLLPNWVNPVGIAAHRPYGNLFRGYSGVDTYVDANPKDPSRQDEAANMFTVDQWGLPWISSDPQFKVQNQPILELGGPTPPVLASTQTMSDPGTHRGPYNSGGGGAGGYPDTDPAAVAQQTGHPNDFFGSVEDVVDRVWAWSPWATVFWGIAAVWLAAELFLPRSGVPRAAAATGSAVTTTGSAPVKAAEGVAKAAADAVGEVTEAAETAIEAIVPG